MNEPTRPRDTQRQKVYDAENRFRQAHNPDAWRADPCDRIEDIDEILRWCKRLSRYAWFEKAYPTAAKAVLFLEIKDGRGTRTARGGRYHLSLPLWARTKAVILHELAHCVTEWEFSRPGYNPAWHGWEFCKVLLKLSYHVFGPDGQKALRGEFRAGRVRYKTPRKPMSEAQRAAAAARLAAARAAG